MPSATRLAIAKALGSMTGEPPNPEQYRAVSRSRHGDDPTATPVVPGRARRLTSRTMYRHSITTAAGLLLLPLALPGVPAQAEEAPAGSGTVTRIITLDSAPAARKVAAPDRAAARGAVDAAQRDLVRAARDAGIDLTVKTRYREVVNGLSVRLSATDAERLDGVPGVAAVAEPTVHETPEAPAPVPTAVLEKAAESAEAAARSTGAPSGRELITTTELTGVPEAHRRGATGKGVTVGIIDSGIAYDHPALGGGGFPNAKVLGGYDFADGDPDPYDELNTAAAGHGTHVAGIVAGRDTHIEGVAPEATLRAYRIFGGKGPTTDETVIAALDRAAADGVDLVNMSLGAKGERSNNLISQAVDALVGSGTPVVVAVGNGYAGPFNAGAPAVADGAIAVGSTYSTRLPSLAFLLNDDAKAPVPFQPVGLGPIAPAAGSAPVTEIASGCDALPAGSLAGRVALFTSPAGTAGLYCKPMDVARTAEAAGAVAAIYHNPRLEPGTMPGSPCCRAIGIPVVSIRGVDAQRIRAAAPEVAALTWGAYAGSPLPSQVAGLMDHSSSWGPGNELEFKPDVAAPGGFIYSALPPSRSWYGVMSGTSMAAPHAAGVVALLLEATPGLTPEQVRTALLSTATPLAMTGAPERGRQPVAQQGAGRIDALAALSSAVGELPTVSPGKLPLRDTEGRQQVRRITLHNPTDQPLTYRIGHGSAVSAAPPYTAQWMPTDAVGTARFDGDGRITLTPGGSGSVTVRFEQPEGVVAGTLFGGWIEFTADGTDAPQLRVPYLGVAGDFDAVSAINPTFTEINKTLDNPALRPRYYSFGRSEPIVVDFTDASTANDKAWVMLSHGFPLLERLRLEVLDPAGRVVATPHDASWVARNSGAGTGMDFLGWDATIEDGSPAPAGVYRLRLVFDKALADSDRAPSVQTWTSPQITLAR
ncbi:S8 family serine peptidase [Streptomyces vietnamensis]|uniref:S8 family serine peptidase n=1 Tax=Streptomyces vietnamensis TaxID=362257 RepID=UPI0034394DB7